MTLKQEVVLYHMGVKQGILYPLLNFWITKTKTTKEGRGWKIIKLRNAAFQLGQSVDLS